MDFAQQQRKPTKHLVGFTFVVILHVLLIYALVNGLAQKIVDVVKPPVMAKIIPDLKPPPPPDKTPPPPPKLLAPPPPYIPPVEVQIQTPPPVNTISQTTTAPPPGPTTITPSAPPAGPAAPPATAIGVVCPNVKSIKDEISFPPKALHEGITSGEVRLHFTVSANGDIKNATIVSTSNRLFNETGLSAVRQLKCAGQGQDVQVDWVIGFRTE